MLVLFLDLDVKCEKKEKNKRKKKAHLCAPEERAILEENTSFILQLLIEKDHLC